MLVCAWTEPARSGALRHYVAICDEDLNPIGDIIICDAPADAMECAYELAREHKLECLLDELAIHEW